MKKQFWLLLCMATLDLNACHVLSAPTPPPTSMPPSTPITLPKIDRRPEPYVWQRGIRSTVPTYDPDSDETWQMDLRGYNLSDLDLSNSLNDLFYASFDEQTRWPPVDRMPQGFDWQHIMELGQNPGLGIRNLHTQRITGRGVGIAIIDQTLLVDHQEYVDRLRLYEETDDIVGGWQISQMHGPAVASIAVGKTVGVAPEADLYYIATARGGKGEDFTYLARSIRRILEVNRQLPDDRKIRVIAMAIGWGRDVQGYDEVTAAAEEAKSDGMLVVCSSIEEVHGFKFHGLGRAPLTDPDRFESYEPGLFWARAFPNERLAGRLLVPMDSRTTASFTAVDEYVFYRRGGWSWSIPYIAGVYALAVQVNPAITPGQFWSQAMETGRTVALQHDGQTVSLGPIMDPVALIDAVQSD